MINVYFKKIQGLGHIFENLKNNVLSIIFDVKICADSKKILILTKCAIFWPLWPKKHISKRNYEKSYIYFNKNNNFQDFLLKIGLYTLYIVPKIVLKFHKDISNDYRNINQISGLSSPKLGILLIKVHLLRT